MNYLARPIFDFEINWANPVNKSFTYDLSEVSLGFGAEFFNALQTHVVQGYQCSVELPTNEAIDEYDQFIGDVLGRLRGFWLPAPFAAVKWKAAVDTTYFDIEDQGLRDTWDAHPDVHLIFITPAGAMQTAKITAVAQQGSGERITLDTALNPQPTAATRILRLHYVRLADDIERGTFKKEGYMTRELRVIELPLEYTEYETGTRPLWLYHFWTTNPGDQHWRYTSFAADVVSANALYSKFPMNHGELVDDTKLDKTLDISAQHDAAHPFALFLPIAFSRTMNVEVIESSYTNPDVQSVRFAGQVRRVSDDGEKLVARCDSWLSVLNRKIPRMQIQQTCNYNLFDPITCKALRAGHETTAVIVAIDSASQPPTVTVDLLYPELTQSANWITEDWFAQGFLETGSGLTYEVRTIVSSALFAPPGRLLLELNIMLTQAIVGQYIQLVRGCDGKPETCEDIFDNFINFGGFRAVPARNLSMKAINAVASQGDKK